MCNTRDNEEIEIPDSNGVQRGLPNGSPAGPTITEGVHADIKEKNFWMAKQSKKFSLTDHTTMRVKISLVQLTIWGCIAVSAATTTNKIHAQAPLETAEKELIKKMDDYNEMDNISIYGDMITLNKMQVVPVERENSSIDEDPLMARIDQFFKSRSLRIRFPSDGSSIDLFGRALGEKNIQVSLRELTNGASEARTRLKRIVVPILLALKLKALIILPIVVTMIGVIGIKGLGAGLLALLLSGAVALKALLTPPPPVSTRVTYGVVRPHHEIHHEHWHRSQEELNQPYRAWSPEQYSIDNYPYELP